jgi:transcriptional regulator with XRE-family HTH domain
VPATSTKQVPQNGSAIRDIREREGMTVSELAQAIGVSDPHMRNIENELRPARPEHMARIVRALGCRAASIRRDSNEDAS